MAICIDFNLADFGTVALLTPVTQAAETWANNHLPDRGIRWGGGIAIQTREVASIVQDIDASGLNVEATYVRAAATPPA